VSKSLGRQFQGWKALGGPRWDDENSGVSKPSEGKGMDFEKFRRGLGEGKQGGGGKAEVDDHGRPSSVCLCVSLCVCGGGGGPGPG
jgi:hypothetical protein